MSEIYTKDRLIKELLHSQTQFAKSQMKIAETLLGVKDNLKLLNDCNILHSQDTVKLTSTIGNLGKYLKWLLILLFLVVGALIIIAGAEKVFTYIKLPW